MPESPEIVGFDALREKFGPWPAFHDAEILRIVLDRAGRLDCVGPSMTFELLVPDKTKDAHYEVHIVFLDIDDLQLANFNYQNVVFSMTMESVTEKRFASGKIEQRVKIRIDSVFGVECSFTCAYAKVLRIEKTDARTGAPKDTAG